MYVTYNYVVLVKDASQLVDCEGSLDFLGSQ